MNAQTAELPGNVYCRCGYSWETPFHENGLCPAAVVDLARRDHSTNMELRTLLYAPGGLSAFRTKLRPDRRCCDKG